MADWFDHSMNSIRAFLDYLDTNLPGTALIYFSSTLDEFSAGVERAIYTAVSDLEKSKRSHTGRKELELSVALVDRLRMAAIPCSAEAYSNGHVDITVEHPRERSIRYLGECKIWDGPAWHRSGCEQLLNRYLTGREARGFVLEFFQQANMMERLRDLSDAFTQDKPLEMIGNPEGHKYILGAFLTTHRHTVGREIQILHFGCDLFSS
jgi:hypothetical protein